MKSNSPAWIYLDPYVHLAEHNGHVLFYNTLSRKILEYWSIPEITKLASQFLNDSNGYVVTLSIEEAANPVIRQLIRQLQKLHMGGLLPVNMAGCKPVNILPQPAFRQKLKPYEEGIERPGLRPQDFIHSINLYINAGLSPITREFPGGYNQFPFPFGEENMGREMDTRLVDKLLTDIANITPFAINIFGSDPCAFPGWKELTTTLALTNHNVKYHLTLPQAELCDLENLGNKSVISVFVTFPFFEEDLATIEKLEKLFPKKTRLEYNFIVKDLSDLEKSKQLIAHFNIRQWFFKPYYTGANMDFFKENVFITAEDIIGSKPNQKQIFSRTTFNENDFGKFTIMPDGTIFANVNDPPLGNLYAMGVISMIEAEMDKGISWTRTRPRVSPCSSCVYNFLCPPISNYEILLRRYNFCHIYKEES